MSRAATGLTEAVEDAHVEGKRLAIWGASF